MPFSDSNRSDTSPKRATESSFSFLNRSARPEIERVRTNLADAIGRFPGDARDELVARLRSGDEVAFRSAAFEVLLHELLLRIGCALEPHPDPGTGTTKRPDFRVIDANGCVFYLEAVLAGERDGRSPGAEAMKATALGVADSAPHDFFMLDVQSEGDPTTQPSGRELAKTLHGWLNSLDAHALRKRIEADGLDAMPQLTWAHEAWEVTARAIPLAPDQRGHARRLIGALGDGVRWVNGWEPLRDAVKKKANRYGVLDKPLVVAINTDSFHLDEIDEIQALYGEEEWVEVLSRPELSGPRRKSNGAWRGPHGPQYRTASAAWFFNDLTPYTVASRRSRVYLNPWANHYAPASLTLFPTVRVEEDKLHRTDGRSLREIFALHESWPE